MGINILVLWPLQVECVDEWSVPVTGASISIMVFSDLSREAPSLMTLNAALSSMRPSRMKCCFNTSENVQETRDRMQIQLNDMRSESVRTWPRFVSARIENIFNSEFIWRRKWNAWKKKKWRELIISFYVNDFHQDEKNANWNSWNSQCSDIDIDISRGQKKRMPKLCEKESEKKEKLMQCFNVPDL